MVTLSVGEDDDKKEAGVMVTIPTTACYLLYGRHMDLLGSPSLVKSLIKVKQQDCEELVSQSHFIVEDTEVQSDEVSCSSCRVPISSTQGRSLPTSI